jgi:predicted NACHT family NTPase
LQVNLDEVFVPLNLDLSMGEFGGRLERLEQQKTFEIWDFLARVREVPSYRCMSILAEGGSGKTTLLRHVAYEYAQGRHRKHRSPKLLPFLLYLRKWRDVIAENPDLTLPQLMTQHVRSLRGGKELKLPLNWADDRLRSGKALILFDGYDEVSKSQRKQVAEWISAQTNLYPNAVFLITSRPSGYDDFKTYAAEVPTTLRVREFDKGERDLFIRKWTISQEKLFRMNQLTAAANHDAEQKAADLIAQIDASPELQKMSANPLQLNLIARVHKFANGAPLPSQKTKLYEQIFDLQLGARPLAKRVEMVLDSAQERQQVLQSVALEMLRQDAIVQVEKSQLLEWIRSPLAKIDESVNAEDFLNQVVRISELMYEAEAEEFAFSHLSFRNYLAMLECLRLENWDEIVRMLGSDGWRETILMLSARLKPIVLHQLVRRTCQLDPENVYLAYDCLVRYPNQSKIDRAWIDELQPLRYAKLERLMKAGWWKDADRETYRLMIQTCGKDVGTGFSVKDLQEFPCEDLLTIDRLWVEASNGHFGFSVQKKIWEEYGSPVSYNDDYRNFMNKVGWYWEIEFVNYTNLKFSLVHSATGELPIYYGFSSEETTWEWDLFSRATTCKI